LALFAFLGLRVREGISSPSSAWHHAGYTAEDLPDFDEDDTKKRGSK